MTNFNDNLTFELPYLLKENECKIKLSNKMIKLEELG